MTPPIKLYLGCALRNASPDFVQSVLKFRERLEQESGFEILRFVDLSGSQPSDVDIFRWDMAQIEACDGVLAICDEPSFGLGFEVSVALSLGKPVLMVAEENRYISAFPQGIDWPGATFLRYRSWDHLFSLVKERLGK